MKKLCIAFTILLLLSFKVVAGEISGVASIIDGDTIKISKKSIRFYGIDAPEKKQKCIKNSKKYNCGQAATDALIKKIQGKQVICKVQKKLDRYKRYIGICFIEKIDINKWLVRSGYAVAYKKYSKDYIGDEKYANKNKLGLWSGSFTRPEKWRKLN